MRIIFKVIYMISMCREHGLVFGQNGDTKLLKSFLSDIKDGYNFELFQITSP